MILSSIPLKIITSRISNSFSVSTFLHNPLLECCQSRYWPLVLWKSWPSQFHPSCTARLQVLSTTTLCSPLQLLLGKPEVVKFLVFGIVIGLMFSTFNHKFLAKSSSIVVCTGTCRSYSVFPDADLTPYFLNWRKKSTSNLKVLASLEHEYWHMQH